jgi:hypothetical protein
MATCISGNKKKRVNIYSLNKLEVIPALKFILTGKQLMVPSWGILGIGLIQKRIHGYHFEEQQLELG